MKRRLFVLSGSGILAGGALAPVAANPNPSSLQVRRSTRVAPDNSILQDLVVENSLAYSLVRSRTGRQWMVNVSTLGGEVVSEFRLPDGTYLSLGLDGNAVWVHALTYNDDQAVARPHTILRFEGGKGESVASLGTSFNGRFRYAGQSRLFHVHENSVNLWILDETGARSRGVGRVLPFRSPGHIDLLTSDLAALVPADGSLLVTVELADGASRDVPLALPEIENARAHYASQSSSGRGEPVVISATGSDRNGTLYALVLPSPRDAVKIVKIDQSGKGAGSLALQFPPRQGPMAASPMRLILQGAELGVVHSDGLINWYSA